MNFTILGKSYVLNPTLNLVLNSFQDLVLKERFRNPIGTGKFGTRVYFNSSNISNLHIYVREFMNNPG